MKLFDLSGKTALVTGGGRGIGKTIALALAEAGANVAITSRTESELKETADTITGFSRRAYYSAVDARNADDITGFVKDIVNQEGKIDILVNGAGTNKRLSFLEVTEEDWDYVMDINQKTAVFTSQAVIPYMKEQRYGKIINIASLTSEIAFPNMSAYAASKGGISQLTKSLAVEFAEDGILVNAIGPGYFKTEMTKSLFADEKRVEWMKSRIPLRRTGEVEELQGAAIFLASHASDYVTGQTIYVDGGWLSS
ncbi:glucose 1-dehydrogenase [Peribacillus cavernae]|uniref:Glucose 1-dehydrogenase n=1 Tax=Peribacillus cavernae TaxID=1674310 RepID=A0A433HK92_9BACI|nr:glucose 1-dehydrogenase [Peribacillus cavernae]MDQ0219157.1 2-deoxy-D-gluconate 3-dehydrogenase [Peribacillus cavernae]RUQ28615.1 glucose 1-dehydrogenase [Peribacillus cavernae]